MRTYVYSSYAWILPFSIVLIKWRSIESEDMINSNKKPTNFQNLIKLKKI